MLTSLFSSFTSLVSATGSYTEEEPISTVNSNPRNLKTPALRFVCTKDIFENVDSLIVISPCPRFSQTHTKCTSRACAPLVKTENI